MSVKIEMKDLPRGSGKTNYLMIKALREYWNTERENVKHIVMCHSQNHTQELERFLRLMAPQIIVIGPSLEGLMEKTRGFTYGTVNLYIDEPFLFDESEQNRILTWIQREHRCNWNVFGNGTRPLSKSELFEDYVC